jgi:hypothetical protein
MNRSLDPHGGAPRAPDAGLEAILTSFDTLYQWDYGCARTELQELYEKGKREQWNGATELDWKTSVDPESEIIPDFVNPLTGYGPYERLDRRDRLRLRHIQISQHLSQFLHGEQGAMIVASQLVAAAPWMEAKSYASSQTMDEARHVEVFSRYVREKLEWVWPIEAPLKELLDATISDARWDFKYMGMQVLIEGLAMAAFGNLYQLTQEPLLKQMLRYVMRDESRHVAFGVLSLRDHYAALDARELREREQFVVYACELMRDRLIGPQLAQAMDWDEAQVRTHLLESEAGRGFRSILFQRIVPNLKRLGLLTPHVRESFEKLGILHFESQDPEAQDRALGFVA